MYPSDSIYHHQRSQQNYLNFEKLGFVFMFQLSWYMLEASKNIKFDSDIVV